ncbi:MAG TPA: GTPase ObgE [Candidatus Caccenecus avistercoris]|nr:GTPase ObgE [Candidatus Caccenecus avistercoris]
MFVDELTIKVEAGKGGDGCTSFRREWCVPMGGPDGGNGGKGASIIFQVDKGLKTLIDLRYMKIIKGKKGENGKGSNKNGANAEDVIIKVPEGTTVIDSETNQVIADLVGANAEVVVAKGGRGGRGNSAFRTQSDTAPKFSELGEPGEEKTLKVELKMIADVGLVGLPSVGKSTILSMISAATPKIASYHFTTLSPNLGVVKLRDGRSFVMADLPGLIEGASLGVGLGHKFLRHAMRTKILAHVIDMGAEEGRNPIQDYQVIRQEIIDYSEKLASKKEIVIANKMDLENAQHNLEEFRKNYPDILIVQVSSVTNTGFDELMKILADMLDTIGDEALYTDEEMMGHVTYKFKNERPFTITKVDDVWVLEGAELEKLFKMTRFDEDEAVMRFARKLKGMGVDEELERLGAKPGDEVQICDYIFEFKE